jgi:heme exporter protein D
MYFESMNDFWAMGGYGFYVWLSYGIGFLSLGLLWLDSVFAKKKLFTQILTEQARQARIKTAAEKAKTE